MDTTSPSPLSPEETPPAFHTERRPILTFWVLVLGSLTAVILLIVAWLFVLYAPMPQPTLRAVPLFTVYPAPTLTDVPLAPTWTPEVSATPDIPTVRPGSIAVGAMVEVSGTGGDGLNLRDAPNTSGKILFRVFERELFRVVDGPQDSNGHTWWLLQGYLDVTRQGWGVENYLKPSSS